MENNEVLVHIYCLVFNHEKYLRNCLDGFVMQKTNFKFQAIVHDDASTDGSAKIIREYANKYPELIVPIIEDENQYSKRDGSLDKIMRKACTAKYVAFCEGDDYWICPDKLQKQVDILESNPNVMMVHTDFETVDENGDTISRYEKIRERSRSGDIFRQLIERGNHVMTLTTIIRQDVYSHPILLGLPLCLDYFYSTTSAGLGDVVYIPEKTAAYRDNPNGLMNTQLNVVMKEVDAVRFYMLQNFIDNKLKRVSFADSAYFKTKYVRMALSQYLNGINRSVLLSNLKAHPSLIFYLLYVLVVFGGKKILKIK